MYKYILMMFVCLMLVGCSSSFFKIARIPQGNQGEATQSDKKTERIIGSIEGEVELPESPITNKNGDPLPNQKIRIDGVDAELPVGSKGKFKISANGKTTLDSITEISSSWKLNSALWLGVGISAGGLGLIGCGILINQYPWVVLIVLGLGLVGSGYYIYVELTKKKLVGEREDNGYVLEELTRAIDNMPEDVLETYIRKPLREHDQSSLIRKVTRQARFRK